MLERSVSTCGARLHLDSLISLGWGAMLSFKSPVLCCHRDCKDVLQVYKLYRASKVCVQRSRPCRSSRGEGRVFHSIYHVKYRAKHFCHLTHSVSPFSSVTFDQPFFLEPKLHNQQSHFLNWGGRVLPRLALSELKDPARLTSVFARGPHCFAYLVYDQQLAISCTCFF